MSRIYFRLFLWVTIITLKDVLLGAGFFLNSIRIGRFSSEPWLATKLGEICTSISSSAKMKGSSGGPQIDVDFNLATQQNSLVNIPIFVHFGNLLRSTFLSFFLFLSFFCGGKGWEGWKQRPEREVSCSRSHSKETVKMEYSSVFQILSSMLTLSFWSFQHLMSFWDLPKTPNTVW